MNVDPTLQRVCRLVAESIHGLNPEREFSDDLDDTEIMVHVCSVGATYNISPGYVADTMKFYYEEKEMFHMYVSGFLYSLSNDL